MKSTFESVTIVLSTFLPSPLHRFQSPSLILIQKLRVIGRPLKVDRPVDAASGTSPRLLRYHAKEHRAGSRSIVCPSLLSRCTCNRERARGRPFPIPSNFAAALNFVSLRRARGGRAEVHGRRSGVAGDALAMGFVFGLTFLRSW